MQEEKSAENQLFLKIPILVSKLSFIIKEMTEGTCGLSTSHYSTLFPDIRIIESPMLTLLFRYILVY